MSPRVWLITGASSGFGLELVKTAASQGDHVLAASRTPEKLKSLETNTTTTTTTNGPGTGQITPVHLDHNEPLPQIQAAIEKILNTHSRTIDIVVNNAAYVQTGMLEEVSPEDSLRQFQANTLGPMNLYRAILPHLRNHDSSRKDSSSTLVTIGSMAAWYPMPGCNLYNASKSALRSLSLGLAGEIAHFGIRHCLVEPGFFRTQLLNPNPEGNIASTRNSGGRLAAYDALNATADGNFASFHGAQLGDPGKGARVIYDVVTSSGVARGRELPEVLPLGSDACLEIGRAASRALGLVEEWRGVSGLSDITE